MCSDDRYGQAQNMSFQRKNPAQGAFKRVGRGREGQARVVEVGV